MQRETILDRDIPVERRPRAHEDVSMPPGSFAVLPDFPGICPHDGATRPVTRSAPGDHGILAEGFEVAGVGEEVAPAGAGQGVAGLAADQQALAGPAVEAEAAVGHTDVLVALGLLQESLAALLGRAEVQVALVEDAPARVARAGLAAVHLRDRTTAAIDRDELLGLLPERVPHPEIGESIDVPFVRQGHPVLAGDEPVVLDQADGAIPGQCDVGLVPPRLRVRLGPGEQAVTSERVPEEGVERVAVHVALMPGDHLARGLEDDRGGQARQAEVEGEVLVVVGPELDRYEKVAGVADDLGVNKRLALHAITVMAPGTGELDPDRTVLRPGFRLGAAQVLAPGDGLGTGRDDRTDRQKKPAGRQAGPHTEPDRPGFALDHRASPSFGGGLWRCFRPKEMRRRSDALHPWRCHPSGDGPYRWLEEGIEEIPHFSSTR